MGIGLAILFALYVINESRTRPTARTQSSGSQEEASSDPPSQQQDLPHGFTAPPWLP